MEISPFCHSSRNVRHGQGVITHNDQIADNTWQLGLYSQNELPEVLAGQFVMLRLPNRSDPLLGRPLALYKATAHSLEVVYLTIGKMTHRLSELRPEDKLELWMPLGNGFPKNDVQHTIIVAGGIGQTPFLMYYQNRQDSQERISLLYGARTASRIACMEDFRQHNAEPIIATDDGTQGYHGLVTDLIENVYQPGEMTQLLCCGPLPMLHSAFFVAQKLGIPCFVSLETPMSCGLGICYGCVIPYRESPYSDWDYRRTCKDGPVFDAYKLRWE